MNFNKSNIKGSKNAILSMTLILLLATTLMMAFAQPAAGQAGVTGVSTGEKTTGFITVAPTLVGVGQTLTVNLWANPVPTAYDYASYWNGFYGVTVTFVRPDGTKDTFMPVDGTGGYIAGEMQGLGALFFFYKPSMAGNWSVSFTMPVQNVTTSAGTVIYQGCTSNTFSFTVQTDMVLAGLLNGYPWSELPNSNVYWSYPINDNNREWCQISGDWTGTTTTAAVVVSPTQTKWQPYGPGPETAHIVWTSPFIEGGIVGGSFGSIDYYAGIPRYVVMDGMVFVNIPNTAPYGQALGKFECINENTGQVLYTANGSISSGIHLPNLLGAYQQSATAAAVGEAITLLANSYGAYQYPYLYGTVTVNNVQYWNFYQALTGVQTRQFNNASTGRLIDGTVLAFGCGSIVGQTGNWVWRWNMTSVSTSGASAGQWPTGITWKVKAPVTMTGAATSIFAVSPDLTTVVVGIKNQYWGYNADTGALLWNLTIPYAITSNEEVPLGMVNDFIVWDSVAATWHCYSEITGTQLWETPSVASSPWATTFTIYDTETNDLNNLYCAAPDGIVYAFSLTDGHLIWQSKPFVTTELPNNALPYAHTGSVMEGGIFYLYAGYSASYQLDPVPRFAMCVAINCTTGDVIWTLNGGVMVNAAANGYILGVSDFDGQTYCIGKGPTSTTVTAQQQVGGSVLVQGSVLDKSPASSSATLSAMFANGVPAISDANMSVWMDYLHMQNSTLLNSPPICTGVPVTLTAVDPNGNVNVIGTATSNYQGNYGFQWTPTTPGLYTIYATFTGSNSYYTSSASTSATVVTVASTTTPAPTATSAPLNYATTSDLMTYIVVGVIAMIIAIAIVGALILRKK